MTAPLAFPLASPPAAKPISARPKAPVAGSGFRDAMQAAADRAGARLQREREDRRTERTGALEAVGSRSRPERDPQQSERVRPERRSPRSDSPQVAARRAESRRADSRGTVGEPDATPGDQRPGSAEGAQRREAAEGLERREAAEGVERREAAEGVERREAAEGAQRREAAEGVEHHPDGGAAQDPPADARSGSGDPGAGNSDDGGHGYRQDPPPAQPLPEAMDASRPDPVAPSAPPAGAEAGPDGSVPAVVESTPAAAVAAPAATAVARPDITVPAGAAVPAPAATAVARPDITVPAGAAGAPPVPGADSSAAVAAALRPVGGAQPATADPVLPGAGAHTVGESPAPTPGPSPADVLAGTAATPAGPARTPVRPLGGTLPGSLAAGGGSGAPAASAPGPAGAAVDVASVSRLEAPPSGAGGVGLAVATSSPAESAPAPAPPAAAAGSPTWPTPAEQARHLAAQLLNGPGALRRGADGVHRLTLHLNPEDLGPVRVVAEVRGDGVRLEITGGSEVAREALRAALPDLRRDLESAGFAGTELDLREGTGQGQRHSRPPERPGPGTSAATALEPDAVPVGGSSVPGRLDLRI